MKVILAFTIHVCTSVLSPSAQTLTSLFAPASQLGATILNQAILPLSNDIVRFLHHPLHLLHPFIRHSAVISVCPFRRLNKINGNVTIQNNTSVIVQVCEHTNSIMEAYLIDPLISSSSYQCPQYVRLVPIYYLSYVVIIPKGLCHLYILCCLLCAIFSTHNTLLASDTSQICLTNIEIVCCLPRKVQSRGPAFRAF